MVTLISAVLTRIYTISTRHFNARFQNISTQLKYVPFVFLIRVAISTYFNAAGRLSQADSSPSPRGKREAD